MKKSVLVFVLGVCSFPAIVIAQDANSAREPKETVVRLDLTTALSLAEKKSFSLKGTRIDLESKRTAARTSWSLFYPTASLTGAFSTGGAQPATPGAAFSDLSVGISAGIVLSPTLAIEIKRQWNNYEIGLATYDQAKATLTLNVKKYYFSLLLQAEQIDLLRKQADAARQRFEAADFKYSHGFLSEIDKLTVEYAYKDKLYTLQAANNSFTANLRQLKDVCGIEAGTEVNLTDSIPDLTSLKIDPTRARIDGNPDLRLLDLNKTQAEIGREQSVAALLPTVSVGGKIAGGYSTDPFSSPLFDASSWSWGGSLSLTVGVTVPLDAYLPYSQTRNALMLRNAAVDKVTYAILDRKQAVQRQAAVLVLTLRQIESQIDSLQVNITMAERNLNLTEQLYNSGKKSFLDLKDAENSSYDAHIRLIGARNDYLSAVLDLENLYNADFGL